MMQNYVEIVIEYLSMNLNTKSTSFCSSEILEFLDPTGNIYASKTGEKLKIKIINRFGVSNMVPEYIPTLENIARQKILNSSSDLSSLEKNRDIPEQIRELIVLPEK